MIQRAPVFGSIPRQNKDFNHLQVSGAQERTRTFTAVKPLAPEASASTNSATWALGAVTTDRSRACQIGRRLAKYTALRDMTAQRESAKQPRESPHKSLDKSLGLRLTGNDPHGIESGHPGYRFRRIGFSGAKRGPRAVQARLPRPGRGAAAGTG